MSKVADAITRSFRRLTLKQRLLAIAGGVVALLVVVGAAAGAAGTPTAARQSPTAATSSTASAPTPAVTPSATGTPTPTATWTDSDPGDVETVTSTDSTASAPGTSSDEAALALLATLTVKPLDPLTGYGRTADFGEAWIDVDHNGCDTRDDILARDLTDITKSGTCKVMTGTLADPYTGTTTSFQRGEQTSALVQIDHVVALADAWRTGAQQLTQDQRILLANDPANLFAVNGRVNEQKSDQDASEWLPPAAGFHCRYVAAQVSVKATYHLWVTQAEHDAMQRVLSSCPDEKATASTFAAAAAPAASSAPGTASDSAAPAAPAAAAAAAPAAAAPATTVDPGGYCSTQGATGVAANGKTYTCGAKGADARGKLHWNAP